MSQHGEYHGPERRHAARGWTLARPLLAGWTAAFGFTAGLVLADFSGVAAPWSEVIRPLSFVAAFSLLSSAVLHRLPLGPALSAVAIVALVAPSSGLWLGLGVLVWIVLYRRFARLRRRNDKRLPPPYPLVVAALAFLAVNVVSAFGQHGFPTPARIPSSSDDAGGRSVYILFLDGYPRGDTLRDDFGYDNEPFLTALEARGFFVDRESESRYSQTALALAYLLGIEETGVSESAPTAEQLRHLRQRYVEAPALSAWANTGYEVVLIRSPMGHVAIEGSLDTGQLNEFEADLIARSLLAPILRGWVFDQARSRVGSTLHALTVAAQTPSSKVVLAHVMAPHPPFLARTTPTCWPECRLWHPTDPSWDDDPGAYAAAVRTQMDYLNPLVLEALDELIAADPSAAIIVFSDHGFRHTPPGTPDRQRNLYAVRGEPPLEIDIPAGH